jgi:DNA-binding transcriptional LysR family regulator
MPKPKSATHTPTNPIVFRAHLADYPLFLQVAMSGNFSQAAQRLNLTPSAVSKRIQMMEQRLQKKLFARSTRSMRLTDAGELFFQHAAQLMQQASMMAEALSAQDQNLAGVLKVAIPASGGFDEALIAFARQYPMLTLHIHSSDHHQDLMDLNVDVALRIGSLSSKHFAKDFRVQKIISTPLCLVASADYLKKYGTIKARDDLTSHRFLAYQNAAKPFSLSLRASQKQKQELTFPCSFSSNQGDILLKAALAGLGVTLLPKLIVKEFLKNKKLIEILPEQPSGQDFALYIVSPNAASQVKKIEVFANFMRQWFEKK